MARDPRPQLSSADQELLKQFQASLAGRSADELARLLPQILGAMPGSTLPGLDPLGPATQTSRRRARRKKAVTYQVRVDLMGTKPPVWRRLELDSDLYLNELHDILQIAFGWTDSHLHEFASGKDFYHHSSEHYLCPFQVDEGEPGVPEEDVRLDEVLAKSGDKLLYLYDFGDDWMHVIKLEAERPLDDSSPIAVCTGGRRPAPGEDCGGVHGFELIAAALDPGHPDHANAVAEHARRYGEEIDPAYHAPTPFDLERINEALADPSDGQPDSPGMLGELAHRIGSKAHRDQFEQLIEDADLDAPVEVDADTAARMVSQYSWLLDRVGADGIKLSAAGYLPGSHVEAALADLELGEEWMGRGNREIHARPLLHLRESAQGLGLLRKYRGSLVLTEHGKALRADPLALWWHLAERMPPASGDDCEDQAGLILLAALAAGSTGDLDATVAGILDAIGWGDIDGTRMTPAMAGTAAWGTNSVLRRLGALADEPGLHRFDKPTPQGVTFARAALRHLAGRT
jgi:hypothetical protein